MEQKIADFVGLAELNFQLQIPVATQQNPEPLRL